MPYGEIRVDTITFTNGGVDTSITVSGLAASTTGNLTVTGTISGAIVRATTVSGVTVTGTTVQGASGTFTSITGGVATITSGVFALGSAAAPSISFSSDPNTGIYSPGADQVAISTAGSGRLFINSTGSLGVGASLTYSSYFPNAAVFNNQGVFFADGSLNYFRTGFGNNVLPSGPDSYINMRSRGWGLFAIQDDVLTYLSGPSGTAGSAIAGSERFRIDSSGRVGIGTSSPSYILETSQPGTGGVVVGASLAASGNGGSGRGTGLLFKAPGSSSAVEVARIDGRQNTASATANDATLNFMVADSGGTLQERLTITNAGRVGIGTTSPGARLVVTDTASLVAVFSRTGSAGSQIALSDSISSVGIACSSGALTFGANGYETERARIDSSGRLLVGTSTAHDASTVLQVKGASGFNGGVVDLQSSWRSTIANQGIGNIRFIDGEGGHRGSILCQSDGDSSSASDAPGRLVFSTTADGASSPTERLRITSAGLVGVGTSAPTVRLQVQDSIAGGSDGTVATLHNFSDAGGDARYVGLNFRIGSDNGTSAIRAARTLSAVDYRTELSFWTNPTGATQTPVRAMTIDYLQRVGIGTTSPGDTLTVAGSGKFGPSGDTNGYLTLDGTTNSYFALTATNGYVGADSNLILCANGTSTERARIDSSGRLLVGTSSTSSVSTLVLQGNSGASGDGAVARLTCGSATPANGTDLGYLLFADSSHADSAAIRAQRDGGTWSGSSKPTRLVFSTTADGASSPTERMRITSAGLVGIGTSSVSHLLDIHGIDGVTARIKSTSGNSGNYSQLILESFNSFSGSGQAYIRGVSSATGNSNTDLVFGTNASGFGSPVERLRITSAGFVGIGTASPANVLQLLRSTNVDTYIQSSNSLASSFYGTAGDGRTLTWNNGAYPLVFGTSDTERARIDSSGRLLVGTSTARAGWYGGTLTSRLQVEGTDFSTSSISIIRNQSTFGAGLILGASGGTTLSSNTLVTSGTTLGGISFQGTDGSVGVESSGISCVVEGTPATGKIASRLVFSTTADGASSPTERMRIRNGGDTGIFCDTNSDVLYLSATAAAGTSRYLLIGKHSATGTITSGTISLLVFTNGNIQNTNNSYAGISDIKLKENVVDAASQWDDIKALQVRKYNFKEETGQQTHTQIGLIAQEVELVSPGLVSESPDRDDEGNDLGTVTKSVNYSVLYMKAVKALQEAMERIEDLEARLDAANL